MFTDDGVAALSQSLILNSTLEDLQFGGSPLSDAVVSDLSKFVEDNRVMKNMLIMHPAGDAFIPPLMKFLKHRAYITKVGWITGGQTQCLSTDGRHSIPSAVDILNNLLVLFVQKDKEPRFKEALIAKLLEADSNIVTACRIHTLEKPPELVLENDNSQWKSGLWVHAPEIGLTSTVGAILVDDEGKLYLTSTFHGNKFEKCQILNKYEGQCVAEVFKTSPLLDACLIEVQDPEGKAKHCPTLPVPHIQADLCGPYTGPNEDLARNGNPTRGKPCTATTSTVVNKYGFTTFLTEGRLLYYNYTHPDPKLDISDALIVLSEHDVPFTKGGDSGAVIFRHGSCADTHTDTVSCHEAIAVHSRGMKLGFQKVSVACRLDDIIEHFEAKLGKRLKLVGTRPNILENFLFRIKLGLVLSEEEPLE